MKCVKQFSPEGPNSLWALVCSLNTICQRSKICTKKDILKHEVKNKNKDTKQVFMKLKSASPTPPIRG